MSESGGLLAFVFLFAIVAFAGWILTFILPPAIIIIALLGVLVLGVLCG